MQLKNSRGGSQHTTSVKLPGGRFFKQNVSASEAQEDQ